MSIDFGQLLADSGAILKGHFQLTSGRHSDTYFEKFRILEQPTVLSALCKRIAAHFNESNQTFDFVAGPTTGGIIIAYEVGRQLGLSTRYVETEAGVKKLRRNATLPIGSRILLVDDVLTTGVSLLEAEAALTQAGGIVSAIAVLIDRSENFSCKVPFYTAYRVSAASYAPEEVPAWLQEIPIAKPGTRA